MSQDEPLLQLDQLVVGPRATPLLPPIDLTVAARTCWAVVGPNGSGKSTLLRTILGLQPALGGRIARRPAAIGYVPQRTELDLAVPARVLDLVRAGSDRGWSFANPFALRHARRRIEDALRDTGIEPLAREPWANLSEGQKQRVLVAQALASEPALLVLDEPTSAMDLHAERSLFQLLDDLRAQRGLAILVVSHHLALLARHATHALFVDRDQLAVLAGPMADVARSPAVVDRFGLALQLPPPALPLLDHGARG